MTERRLLSEWPLAVFTLALQVACGLALATTAFESRRVMSNAALRPLAMSIFPVLALGLLFSLMHLGRPLSAWRALSNIRHSRLSSEVLLTVLFSVAALVYSCTWLADVQRMRFSSGVITCIFGLASVISSAAIYRIRSKPLWDSVWVVASFLGTTMTITGLAALFCATPNLVFTGFVLAGSALVFLSAAWLWPPLSRLPLQPAWLRPWFGSCIALAIPLPLVLLFGPSTLVTGVAGCAALFGMFSGRLLMYAAASLENQF